jgi:hypothetical protein
MTVSAPKFNERAVKQIRAFLPTGIDQRRLDLLPLILDEWSRTDLREHLSRESRAMVRERYDRLAKIGKCANDLRQALEAIDQRGMSWIAQEMALEDGNTDHEKLIEMKERLKDEGDFLRKLAAAKVRLIEEDKRGPGQPRNIRAYLVMKDLAAIFEWLTDRKATRGVDRTDHTETGPFFRFAQSIWPVAFGNTRGLKAAIKNFVEARKLYQERSPFLYNIAFHHPTWGIFEH